MSDVDVSKPESLALSKMWTSIFCLSKGAHIYGAPFLKKLITFLRTKYFFHAASSCFCQHEVLFYATSTFFCWQEIHFHATSTRFCRNQITFRATSNSLFQHKIIFRVTSNFCFGHHLECYVWWYIFIVT